MNDAPPSSRQVILRPVHRSQEGGEVRRGDGGGPPGDDGASVSGRPAAGRGAHRQKVPPFVFSPSYSIVFSSSSLSSLLFSVSRSTSHFSSFLQDPLDLLLSLSLSVSLALPLASFLFLLFFLCQSQSSCRKHVNMGSTPENCCLAYA